MGIFDKIYSKLATSAMAVMESERVQRVMESEQAQRVLEGSLKLLGRFSEAGDGFKRSFASYFGLARREDLEELEARLRRESAGKGSDA